MNEGRFNRVEKIKKIKLHGFALGAAGMERPRPGASLRRGCGARFWGGKGRFVPGWSFFGVAVTSPGTSGACLGEKGPGWGFFPGGKKENIVENGEKSGGGKKVEAYLQSYRIVFYNSTGALNRM